MNVVFDDEVKADAQSDLIPGQHQDDSTKTTAGEKAKALEERNAFNAGIGAEGTAKKVGLTDKNSATKADQAILRDRKQREDFFRHQMLRRAMAELQQTLNEIGEAIEATNEAWDLFKEGKLDLNNEDHIMLLILAGIDPDDVREKGEQAFIDRLEALEEQEKRAKNALDEVEDLKPDDPDLEEKIKNLSGDLSGQYQAGGALFQVGGDDLKEIAESEGLSEEEAELLAQMSAEMSGKSPAQEVYGETIKAPKMGEHFSSAAAGTGGTQEPVADNSTTPDIKIPGLN